MRPTTAPTQADTARPPEKLADATTGTSSKSDGDSLPRHLANIADLIGSADDDLPADLSARTNHYLRVCGFGRNRSAHMRQQR